MNRIFLVFSAMLLFLLFSCEKPRGNSTPVQAEREKSIPEIVENELIGVIDRDWKSLADTMKYFSSTMLSRGKTCGIAPDGNRYCLDTRIPELFAIEASFSVNDSTFAEIKGRILPLELNFRACGTNFDVRKEADDTLSLTAGKLQARIPEGFLHTNGLEAPLLYESCKVGFITMVEMENLDYSTGTYLLIHYYNDPRTFAFFDNGLGSVLGEGFKLIQ